MEYKKDKVDEMALALLYLTSFEEKGYIGNPKNKAKSVHLTEEGARLSEALFKKHFGIPE